MPKIIVDPNAIKRLHKDVLAAMKAAQNVVDVEDIGVVRRGIRNLAHRYEQVGAHIRKELEGRLRAAQSEFTAPDELKANASDVQYLLDNQKPFWDFVYQLRSIAEVPGLESRGGAWKPPEQVRKELVDFWLTRGDSTSEAEHKTDDYLRKYPAPTRAEADAAATEKWKEKTRTWRDRVLRYSRDAHKWLSELGEWSAGRGGGRERLVVSLPDSENVQLEGFNLIFQGFEESSYKSELPAVKAGLKKYRDLASKRAPLLLKQRLPIFVEWTFDPSSHGDAAAYYTSVGGGQVHLTPWTIGKNVGGFVKTMAHEVGHHLFRAYLSGQATSDWTTFIRGDYKDLDLREAVAEMQAAGVKYPSDKELMRANPILFLQLETLSHGGQSRKLGDLFSVAQIEKYIAEGNSPLVRVPTHPITGYANKNPEEAFCEALGTYVAYGPRALLGVVKMMLFAILPGGDVREASAKRVIALSQQLPGGRGRSLTPDDVDPDQLSQGIKVEKEHTEGGGLSPERVHSLAQEIALDHLAEFPDYYTRLNKMEKEGAAGDWTRPARASEGGADRYETIYKPPGEVGDYIDDHAYVAWYGPSANKTYPDEEQPYFAWASHNHQKNFDRLNDAKKWAEKTFWQDNPQLKQYRGK